MNPMFEPSVYKARRDGLRQQIASGIAVFLGNQEAPMNYPSNTYKYRQNSHFIYFFGLTAANLAAIIDFDENREILVGDNLEIDDIIWMGDQPTMRDLADKCAVAETMPMGKLADYIGEAMAKGRKVHFTPPYRDDNKITLSVMTGIPIPELKKAASLELIKAIVKLRTTKEERELEQMRLAGEIGYKMHTTVMRHCVEGVSERELAGMAEGISLSYGNGVSFPIILSQHGETMHNHNHDALLKKGNMLLMDAGAEGLMNYCSDNTRTMPIGGTFTPKQKDIYEIVLKANMDCIEAARPGVYNRDLHFNACRIITNGLKALGLMKGDTEEAVRLGAHALFMPHGLGHQLGLDVHDMEDLGEDYVGYDETVSRSPLFGTAYLRMARELKPGYVVTIEPGIYFVPQLIDIWKKENKLADFICYDKVETYKDFGGIRIEDDVLITATGHEILGPVIPKTVDELKAIIPSK